MQMKNRIMEQSLEDVCGALAGEGALPAENKLAQRLVKTIEQHEQGIGWLVDSRRTGRVRPRIRCILAWAIAEMLWMDGVAAEGVVNAAVEHVKKRYSRSDANFVNGFLRRLLSDCRESGEGGLFAKAPAHVRFELPELLWKRWTRQYGVAETMRIAEALQKPARPILRLRGWPPMQIDLPAGLEAVAAPDWAPGAKLFSPKAAPFSLDEIMGAEKSPFYIQDMATLLAPSLLAPVPGEAVADLCAAPGGKALLLGEMLEGRGRLLCADCAEAKLPRLKANLWSIPNAEFAALDAASHRFGEAAFEAILLDVPCSNSGVIRRKPDVRRHFTPQRLKEVLEIQRGILDNVVAALKPNGRLVYSTCSIEAEENQQQIRTFLQRHPDFTLVRDRALLPTADHDGAYAALVRRLES